MSRLHHQTRHEANPFSTRFVRPGGIEFQFPPDVNAENLVSLLRQDRWRGQIVGPHGSGKSTLLHALAPELKRAGREVVWFTLNSQTRRLPLSRETTATWTESTQVIVDGYEQLGWRSRKRFKRHCRRFASGLLVTSHRAVGLPTLFRASVRRQQAHDIVEVLLSEQKRFVAGREIDAAYDRHGGNLREVLFELYDLFEQRRQDRIHR